VPENPALDDIEGWRQRVAAIDQMMLARLAESGATTPVGFHGPLSGWVIVGYDEAASVLTDPGERFAILSGDPELTFWFEAPNMITVDGPSHHRLRAALAPLFTLRAVAKWEQRVAEVAAQMLAPLTAGEDSVDLIAEFTLLPTVITADMLGVPEERYADFRRWSHEVVTNLLFGHEDDLGRAVLQRAATEVNAYLREEIERHRREQPDDLLTYMLNLSGEDAMSDDEIRSTAVLRTRHRGGGRPGIEVTPQARPPPGDRDAASADRGLGGTIGKLDGSQSDLSHRGPSNQGRPRTRRPDAADCHLEHVLT
jgi:cytochrome P450